MSNQPIRTRHLHTKWELGIYFQKEIKKRKKLKREPNMCLATHYTAFIALSSGFLLYKMLGTRIEQL